jgi:SAM-dependent methyltransferase
LKQIADKSGRTSEQVREHYEVEKSLASRLKRASKEERRSALNVELHEELFRRIPHHPLLTQRRSQNDRHKAVSRQLSKFSDLLDANKCFLEIGPGDCAVSFAVAEKVAQVYAVDVNKLLTDENQVPSNFQLFISDGVSIPVQPGRIDIAYSDQLMEHLHPEDAYDQLENVYEALAPGGVYFCETPNRLNGPHDISRFFDDVATGFHLKEYTVGELAALFREAGFTKVQMCTGFKGKYHRLPTFPARLLEWSLQILPRDLQKKLASLRPIRALINVSMVGTKTL